jgi:2-polyprenyl-6-methoxyphenol hydroxylase-like FAD-dependent oxidoreductase
MSDTIIDVLVIGAGPTGTALAIDLARRGCAIRIIDKAPHAFDGSRAKGLQPRTLEVLDDLDALDDVLAGGSAYPLLGIHIGPLTIPWRMFSVREPTADVPFPNTWLIPQYRTDRALHARLIGLGHTVEFDKELIEFTHGPGTVTARVASPGRVEQITARYLVGADGGASVVRKQLDVSFVGSTHDDDRMIIFDARVNGLSGNRWHVWPGRRGHFIAACPLPHSDLFQWMIRLAPSEEPRLDEAELNERIQSRTHNRQLSVYDVQWRSVFRPNIRMVEHYRRGRVILAGDAAHVHTPAGAQGLNTAIQDAYNLGWKLGQVLAGANDRLLDSYEAERLPVAAGVLGLSTKKYEAIAKRDPSSIRRGADEQQLKVNYRSGPLAHHDCNNTRTLRVGDRAPDAEIFDADGGRIRLSDAYRGPHFTAIAYGARAAYDLKRLEWPGAGAPLKRLIIGTADGPIDTALADTAHTFRRVYGLTSDTVLLIRPDGYIGHIATQHWLDTTHKAAQAMSPSTEIAYDP